MFSQASTPPRGTRTPRRAGTRASRAATAALSGETTPRGSPPPTAPAPASTNRKSARLGAELNLVPGAAHALSIGPSTRRAKSSVASRSDVGSAMDLDEGATTNRKDKEDALLVKDDHYIVTERKGLPAEVHQVFSSADPYTEPLQATLDSQTGFAFVVGREHCFVWNWTKRSANSTTYTFPLPASTLPAGIATVTPLCFASFVPSSGSASTQHQREPGLLVVSPTGLLRLWDSISMALSGVERFKALTAPLNEGELARGLKMLSPTSYLISTSHSRILLVTMSFVGGRASVAIRALDRSVGWAGSMWTAVFGGQKADPSAGIRALAISEPNVAGDGRTLAYAMTDKSVQVWDLPWFGDGAERLATDQDIFASVLEGISGEKVTNEDWALNKAQAELIDAAVVPTSGVLALLVSHVTERTAPGSLSYSIVTLRFGSAPTSVELLDRRLLAYQAPPDPRPLSSPKLNFASGTTAFVTFVDAVVMVSLSSDGPFEEAFPLRINTQRFLGTSTPIRPRVVGSSDGLSLLTSSASTIHIAVSEHVEPGREFMSTEAFKTRRLKKKIEQAVYFGAGNEENPLAFDLPSDFEGDLAAAVEAVSTEILSSASEHLPVILDLRAQLTDRAHRAKALIEFIGANGLLGKLPQSCRRRLSWNAERLAAGLALWRHRNSNAHAGSDLLAEAIYSQMSARFEQDLDPMRAFFRTHLSTLGKVLEALSQQARSLVADSRSSLESQSAVIYEANQIYILVFNTVALHRRDTAKMYGLDPERLPIEPWSSRSALLEALPWHFETTDVLLKERVREFGLRLDGHESKTGELVDLDDKRDMQEQLRKQMEGLAEHTFSTYEERLLFQKSDDTFSAIDNRKLNGRYLAIRAQFIQALVNIGKVPSAYELAERHRDFRALVELCTDAQHGSPARIRYFMGKYAQDFAFSLYQFYVERGEHQTLLQQDDEYRPLLTKFLDSVGSPEIAWVNDLAIGRYQNVTQTLVEEAIKEQNIAQKKVMLSISKLSQIAQATSATLNTEEVQRAIEVVDDIIDLVNTQENLALTFKSLLSGHESRSSVDEQAEAIASRVAPTLHDMPALSQLYSRLTAQLFAGITLSAEDLVDLLSLKENLGEQSGEYAAALEILARAEDIPEARRQVALQNVWRRIYLRDDWASLRAANGLTDDELGATLRGTALYSTLAAAARADLPPALYLEPGRSLFVGGEDEVAARFPELEPSAVEGLLAAYDDENRQLQEALQQHDLDTYAKEIVRLLQDEGVTSEQNQVMIE